MDMQKFAAAVCGQGQPHCNNPRTVVLAGLYQFEYGATDDLVLDCHLEYERGERATRDEPGEPESISLVYALVNGVDIADVLREDMIAEIEESALVSMETDKHDAEYDRAADRYEDSLL